MKIAVVFLAVAVAYATARRPKPCDGIDNIESCLCGDEASTEVTDPRDCRDVMAKPVSCACVDGSEWEAPEAPEERPKICDGNIDSCVCGDEAATQVTNPKDCFQVQARPVSCACGDGSEWEAPEPPCGGRENVAGCAENEETGEAEITCNDGTVEPAPGGRCRGGGGRGGRGRGRGGRGRGGRGRGGRGRGNRGRGK